MNLWRRFVAWSWSGTRRGPRHVIEAALWLAFTVAMFVVWARI